MDDQTNTKRVAFATLEFLDEEFKKTTTSPDSKESLEVAIQCLETAFGISLRDTQYRSPRSLRELVRNASSSGGGAVGGVPVAATVGAGDSNTVSSSSAAYNPLAGASVSVIYKLCLSVEPVFDNLKKLTIIVCCF